MRSRFIPIALLSVLLAACVTPSRTEVEANIERATGKVLPQISEAWRRSFVAGDTAKLRRKQLRIDLHATNSTNQESIYDVTLTVTTDKALNSAVVVGVARNVTSERSETKKLEHQSTVDSLTSAYNRAQLELLSDEFYQLSRLRFENCDKCEYDIFT